MMISGLSPEAHGTLLALRDLREIRVHDEAVAGELVQQGYAEMSDGKLRLIGDGIALRPFDEKSLNG